jgi:hypothetical protein
MYCPSIQMLRSKGERDYKILIANCFIPTRSVSQSALRHHLWSTKIRHISVRVSFICFLLAYDKCRTTNVPSEKDRYIFVLQVASISGLLCYGYRTNLQLVCDEELH